MEAERARARVGVQVKPSMTHKVGRPHDEQRSEVEFGLNGVGLTSREAVLG